MAKSSMSSAAAKTLAPSLDDAPYNLLLVEARKLGIKRKQPETPRGVQPGETKSSRSRGPSPEKMIHFELHPQRGLIMHLRKYVAKKMKLVKPEEVEILCKGSPVGPELSLEFIRLTRWKEDAKMILEYRRKIVASYE
ncbi:hypothetical protein BBJ28_00022756 [Nothophytophthora sp. Chile5]|nr:hypothetical protein BBJ28_00022756 [Nothophytophthora sp. Chile5]